MLSNMECEDLGMNLRTSGVHRDLHAQILGLEGNAMKNFKKDWNADGRYNCSIPTFLISSKVEDEDTFNTEMAKDYKALDTTIVKWDPRKVIKMIGTETNWISLMEENPGTVPSDVKAGYEKYIKKMNEGNDASKAIAEKAKLFSMNCRITSTDMDNMKSHLRKFHNINTTKLTWGKDESGALGNAKESSDDESNEDSGDASSVVQAVKQVKGQDRMPKVMPDDPSEVEMDLLVSDFRSCLWEGGIVAINGKIEQENFHKVKNMLEACLGPKRYKIVFSGFKKIIQVEQPTQWKTWEKIIRSQITPTPYTSNMGSLFSININDNVDHSDVMLQVQAIIDKALPQSLNIEGVDVPFNDLFATHFAMALLLYKRQTTSKAVRKLADHVEAISRPGANNRYEDQLLGVVMQKMVVAEQKEKKEKGNKNSNAGNHEAAAAAAGVDTVEWDNSKCRKCGSKECKIAIFNHIKDPNYKGGWKECIGCKCATKHGRNPCPGCPGVKNKKKKKPFVKNHENEADQSQVSQDKEDDNEWARNHMRTNAFMNTISVIYGDEDSCNHKPEYRMEEPIMCQDCDEVNIYNIEFDQKIRYQGRIRPVSSYLGTSEHVEPFPCDIRDTDHNTNNNEETHKVSENSDSDSESDEEESEAEEYSNNYDSDSDDDSDTDDEKEDQASSKHQEVSKDEEEKKNSDPERKVSQDQKEKDSGDATDAGENDAAIEDTSVSVNISKNEHISPRIFRFKTDPEDIKRAEISASKNNPKEDLKTKNNTSVIVQVVSPEKSVEANITFRESTNEVPKNSFKEKTDEDLHFKVITYNTLTTATGHVTSEIGHLDSTKEAEIADMDSVNPKPPNMQHHLNILFTCLLHYVYNADTAAIHPGITRQEKKKSSIWANFVKNGGHLSENKVNLLFTRYIVHTKVSLKLKDIVDANLEAIYNLGHNWPEIGMCGSDWAARGCAPRISAGITMFRTSVSSLVDSNRLAGQFGTGVPLMGSKSYIEEEVKKAKTMKLQDWMVMIKNTMRYRRFAPFLVLGIIALIGAIGLAMSANIMAGINTNEISKIKARQTVVEKLIVEQQEDNIEVDKEIFEALDIENKLSYNEGLAWLANNFGKKNFKILADRSSRRESITSAVTLLPELEQIYMRLLTKYGNLTQNRLEEFLLTFKQNTGLETRLINTGPDRSYRTASMESTGVQIRPIYDICNTAKLG